MSYGVGRRRGPDLALLWLWCGLAAVAPIQPLAWEPPYAADAALKEKEKEKKKKECSLALFQASSYLTNLVQGTLLRRLLQCCSTLQVTKAKSHVL